MRVKKLLKEDLQLLKSTVNFCTYSLKQLVDFEHQQPDVFTPDECQTLAKMASLLARFHEEIQ